MTVRGRSGGWILHVDADQFLASVELQRRPDLVGLPVIVGGNGDPTEARKVVTAEYQERIAAAITAGVDAYAAQIRALRPRR